MAAVSVIVNCYNGAEYLPKALQCIKAQSFQDFEIIFWDNCSTDDSAEIAQAYGPKLRYFKSESCLPLGQARNLAIKQSACEFIAFLDCDDLWRPTKLARQVELFRANPKVGLVCTDTEIYDGKKILYRLFSRSKPERGNVFKELMIRQWISMSSAMLSRKALDSLLTESGLAEETPQWFDPRFNVCEEADVFYRVAHDWELDYVAEPLTVWKVHGSNTTFQKFEQFADETMLILEKHRQLYSDYNLKYADVVKTLSRRAAFQKAIALWRDGGGAEARKLIAPHAAASLKYRLFWWASFLPGGFFNAFSRLYFALPAIFRR